MSEWLLHWARRLLPVESRRRIVRLTRWPPVGRVRFGHLRRLSPISPHWGEERGQPVDRYYIEGFLEASAADVRGHVLEIGEDRYTRKFGGEQVVRSDVLHVADAGPPVTIVGDLTHADPIPDDTFDCIILTQTLPFIYDVPAALRTIHRILRPGGVVLATVPGISKIDRYEMNRWDHFWNFTSRSARLLFEAVFPGDHVQVATHGNVLAAVAFLHGLACRELSREELDYHDPDFELLITVRAQKPGGSG